MVTNLHIYRVREQPATAYKVDLGRAGSITIRHDPRCLIWCHSCRRLRWAEKLVAHAYYDGTSFFCADKARCKRERLSWRKHRRRYRAILRRTRGS